MACFISNASVLSGLMKVKLCVCVRVHVYQEDCASLA